LLNKKTKTSGGWWGGKSKRSEPRFKKDLVTYVDKPTRYVGLGYASTGWPEGKQDRQSVRRKTDT
jgi:hypothetical protein